MSNKYERAIKLCLLEMLEKEKMINISTTKLCELAEISKPTFYKYFMDKHDAFFQWYLDQIRPYLDLPLDLYFIEELKILNRYRNVFLNVLSYDGQNSFMSEIVQHDLKKYKRHIRIEIIEQMHHLSVYGLEVFICSWWEYFIMALKSDTIDYLIKINSTRNLFAEGSYNIICRYLSIDPLPDGKHI